MVFALARDVLHHGIPTRDDDALRRTQRIEVGFGNIRVEIVTRERLSADAHVNLVAVPDKGHGHVRGHERRSL
jgi:hypothetical protein